MNIYLIIGILFLVIGIAFCVGFAAAGVPAVIFLLPLVFVLIGGGLLYAAIRKMLKAKKLRETGRKVYAQITELAPNYSVTINGRHPYIIHCVADGIPYQGDYSKRITENLIGKTIVVYVSTEDPAEYFVDTSSI